MACLQRSIETKPPMSPGTEPVCSLEACVHISFTTHICFATAVTTKTTLLCLVAVLVGSARPSRPDLASNPTVAEPGVPEVLFAASRIHTYTVLVPFPDGRVQGVGLLKGWKLVQVGVSDMHLWWIDQAGMKAHSGFCAVEQQQ